MTTYKLGTIKAEDDIQNYSRKQYHFEFVADLMPDEYEKLLAAIGVLNEFIQDSQLFMITAWNFTEFMDLIDCYLQALINKNYNFFVEKPIQININRAFLNLLSSMRSYLDFMERLLKKRYGEESAILNSFKQNCSKEYDENFSYRFLYNLRHYAQHKGFPIGNIKWGQQINSDNPPKVISHLEVAVLRDKILEDFDWRALQEEIKVLPEKIDIIPYIVSFMDSLSRIHVSAVKELFQTLTDSAKQVVTAGERLAGIGGEPVIFEVEGDLRNLKQLHHISIPIMLAQQIVAGQLVNIIRHPESTAD